MNEILEAAEYFQQLFLFDTSCCTIIKHRPRYGGAPLYNKSSLSITDLLCFTLAKRTAINALK